MRVSRTWNQTEGVIHCFVMNMSFGDVVLVSNFRLPEWFTQSKNKLQIMCLRQKR
ncbi:MAG: hypothetical protein QME42_11960 [bacterium]|nr:hypothetical protein [bacterium]